MRHLHDVFGPRLYNTDMYLCGCCAGSIEVVCEPIQSCQNTESTPDVQFVVPLTASRQATSIRKSREEGGGC